MNKRTHIYLRTRRTIAAGILLVLAGTTAPTVHAQTQKSLTLVTYYPAPIGAFDRLRLVPRSTLTGACDGGSLYVEQPDSLFFCHDDGTPQWISFGGSVWTGDENHNVYLTDIADPENKRVGIGTSTPDFKLTLDNDGGILAIGGFGAGEFLPASSVNPRFIWYPRKAAIRAGQAAGGQWDEANIGDYSVAFGLNNRASGAKSTILGGEANVVSVSYGSIGGGRNNLVSNEGAFNGSYGTVVGGESNLAKGLYSFIGGGSSNEIAGPTSAVIVGGDNNTIFGTSAIIGPAIGGGKDHFINGSSYATIVGGFSHSITGSNSVIVGGNNHSILGSYNTIVGGDNNSAQGTHSAVVGGRLNMALGNHSSVVGGGGDGPGADNSAQGSYSRIGGGYDNSALGNSSTTMGGYQNSTQGGYDFVGGGQTNSILGANSSIVGGLSNRVSTGGSYSLVGGGKNNILWGTKSVILGGESNSIDMNHQHSWAGGRNMKANGDRVFLWGHAGATVTASQNDTFIIYSGDVGIGSINPDKKVHVESGDMRVDGRITISNAPTGSVGSSLLREAATGKVGFDFAEIFPTSEDVQAGEVLVIDDAHPGTLKKAARAYDENVVGVASASPALTFEGDQIHIAPQENRFTGGNKPPVALAGRVLCKVSTENGAIEAGDLLTTSSVPGHAMRATDPDKTFDAVVGKALESFDGGANGEPLGEIYILVTVQ